MALASLLPPAQLCHLIAHHVGKWTVTLAVQTRSFENTKFETIPITVASPNKPFEAIAPGSPVTVEGLDLGIMPQARGGFSVFYATESIRPL